jgi:taurine dehydrogenase small subunit
MTDVASRPVDFAFLESFCDAFNRHDLDALMEHMTDDCIFDASAGPTPDGRRYAGQAAVRGGFAEVFATFPDGQWAEGRHLIAGDRGLSEWVFRGTKTDGTRVEVRGIDVFTFRDGKIAVKDSFRKFPTW